MTRQYPIGAEAGAGGTHFRVWAPRRKRVDVVLPGFGEFPLEREPDGHHAGWVEEARDGSLYQFRLDGGDAFPDPASRFQPEGPHGCSQVVDPATFRWTDSGFAGVAPERRVVYEIHIGTFTSEGTFQAAQREIAELAAAGITILEVMPVADFPGRFGWGYDGVGLFAPVAIYGAPDDFRSFINEAHRHGIGVILDVVYNHVGPDGNYLRQYSEDYFTERYKNEWGEPINFDGENSCGAREWVLTNAAYWIEEFHLDGLRLDATQAIFDSSPVHILTAIARTVRSRARGRQTFIVGENEPQHTRLVMPAERGGNELDALWNDDFHHAAVVAVTGHGEAYYSDYRGQPQEFISAVKYGYLYQGQRYSWQKQRRGTPGLDLPPDCFVTYIDNHDQIANSGRGERLHQRTSPGRFRAITALMLLAPATPMLFQGQEFGASTPFFYFADHEPELAACVREGRLEFLAQFRSLANPEMRAMQPKPADPLTFQRSKLNFEERKAHAPIYRMHRDLLRLRREDACFSSRSGRRLDGAVLGEEAFVLRWFGIDGDDRLLLVNFGRDLHLDLAPEPLLAPPFDRLWTTLWSSEDPLYGGGGTAPLDTDENWRIPGHAAVVMAPAAVTEGSDV